MILLLLMIMAQTPEAPALHEITHEQIYEVYLKEAEPRFQIEPFIEYCQEKAAGQATPFMECLDEIWSYCDFQKGEYGGYRGGDACADKYTAYTNDLNEYLKSQIMKTIDDPRARFIIAGSVVRREEYIEWFCGYNGLQYAITLGSLYVSEGRWCGRESGRELASYLISVWSGLQANGFNNLDLPYTTAVWRQKNEVSEICLEDHNFDNQGLIYCIADHYYACEQTAHNEQARRACRIEEIQSWVNIMSLLYDGFEDFLDGRDITFETLCPREDACESQYYIDSASYPDRDFEDFENYFMIFQNRYEAAKSWLPYWHLHCRVLGMVSGEADLDAAYLTCMRDGSREAAAGLHVDQLIQWHAPCGECGNPPDGMCHVTHPWHGIVYGPSPQAIARYQDQ